MPRKSRGAAQGATIGATSIGQFELVRRMRKRATGFTPDFALDGFANRLVLRQLLNLGMQRSVRRNADRNMEHRKIPIRIRFFLYFPVSNSLSASARPHPCSVEFDAANPNSKC